jgi:hypothetical protein
VVTGGVTSKFGRLDRPRAMHSDLRLVGAITVSVGVFLRAAWNTAASDRLRRIAVAVLCESWAEYHGVDSGLAVNRQRTKLARDDGEVMLEVLCVRERAKSVVF